MELEFNLLFNFDTFRSETSQVCTCVCKLCTGKFDFSWDLECCQEVFNLLHFILWMSRFIKERKKVRIACDSVQILLFVFIIIFFPFSHERKNTSVTHLSWLSVCRFILYVNSMKKSAFDWCYSFIDKWMRNEYNMGIKSRSLNVFLFSPFLLVLLLLLIKLNFSFVKVDDLKCFISSAHQKDEWRSDVLCSFRKANLCEM